MKECNLNEDSQAVQYHLGSLQSVIQRMATNSLHVKTWCITVVSAILIFTSKTQPEYAMIALMPICLFCWMDSYYLALERSFRKSYEEFVGKVHGGTLKIEDLFVVRPKGNSCRLRLKVLMSFSIGPFYGVLALMVLIIRYIIL